MNFGEFFKLVYDCLGNGITENIAGAMAFESWQYKLKKTGKWQKMEISPLTRELILEMATQVATSGENVLGLTESQILRQDRIRAFHAALQVIHEKAVEQGMNVKREEIEAPITPEEKSALMELFMAAAKYKCTTKKEKGKEDS